MTLTMIRPFKHPKTGTYWLRKTVPTGLREVIRKRELKVTLETKDHREAKAKAGPIIERFDAIITAARAGGVGGDRLTKRDVDALCGEWYREQMKAWGDDPDDFGDVEIYLTLLGDQVEDTEEGEYIESPTISLTPQDRTEARNLLASHG